MRENHKFIAGKIRLPFKIKRPALALGAQTKNTLCFARGDFAYFSPIHADLSQRKDLLAFEQAAKYFLKQSPKIIACDLHPEYQSSKFASDALRVRHYKLQRIQHHHAHIASCMAENGLKNQKVIGVAFDGTGLGADEQLWGGEFLICDYRDFKRALHLKEVPLLGGEEAIRAPWRLSAAWLYAIYKDRFLNLGIGFVKKIDRSKWQALKKMYLSGFNSPLASSMGRLFDAVGSLVLGKYKAEKEAELAIALEKLAVHQLSLRAPAGLPAGRQGVKQSRFCDCFVALRAPRNDDIANRPYAFDIIKLKENYILDPVPMFRAIVKDLKVNVPREKIAFRFHLTVAEMIKRACLVLRKLSGINRVVLSGGVFQNNLLLGLSLDLLYKHHFTVLTHKNLSSGDASVSLGEAVIASSRS